MRELRLTSLSRFKNKQWLNDEIADKRVGGLIRHSDTDNESKCLFCNRKVYLADTYDKISDMLQKEHIILCPYCVLEKFKNLLNNEQKQVLIRCIQTDNEVYQILRQGNETGTFFIGDHL